MRLSISVNLLGRCVTVCLLFSLWFALPASTGGQQGRRCYCRSMSHADLTLLLHTHQVADGACCYCLPLTRIACRCCCCYCTPVLLTGPPTHMAYGIAFAIAYPCRIQDCLQMLALHVNVYALITLQLWSILRLSQPHLQRRPSVVTVAAHLSTYCSFPVCARFWLARMPKKAHFGRTFLDLSALAGRSLSVNILAKHGGGGGGCRTPSSISCMISHLGRGTPIAKINLKHAFLQCPVHPMTGPCVLCIEQTL